MTRPLPLDLAAVAEAESSARANAALRLLHWSAWGEDWTFGPEQQEARDLDAMIALDVGSPARELLADLVVSRLARARARAETLRAAGSAVGSVRIECFGPILPLASGLAQHGIGFGFDRNLGLPRLSSKAVRAVIAAGARVPPEGVDGDVEALPGSMAEDRYADPAKLVVFDAIPVTPPAITTMKWDKRWAPADEGTPATVACVARGTEFEFWFASRDAALVDQAIAHLERGMKALGLAGPPPEPEVIVQPEPEPEPVPAVEATPVLEEPATPPEEPAAAEPVVEAQVQEPQVPPAEQGPTTIPENVPTITVRVPSVQYLPNNGRVFVMFVPPDGRDPMKAEEHISAVAMTEELRARLKKKKVLIQVKADVEAVGNSWRLRGIAL